MTVKKKVVKKKAQSRRKSVSANRSDSIDFHYIKGKDFRSIHVDGAIGGLTNKGFMHIALFAERAPIPQKTTFRVTSDGMLGDEIVSERVSKEGVIREMQVDLIMNEDTARDLRNWLDQRLEDVEARRKELKAENKNAK